MKHICEGKLDTFMGSKMDLYVPGSVRRLYDDFVYNFRITARNYPPTKEDERLLADDFSIADNVDDLSMSLSNMLTFWDMFIATPVNSKNISQYLSRKDCELDWGTYDEIASQKTPEAKFLRKYSTEYKTAPWNVMGRKANELWFSAYEGDFAKCRRILNYILK